MADLVIGLFQDLAAHLISTSCCHATHASTLDALYDQLPQSILRNGAVDSVDRCYLVDDFKALENGIQVWPSDSCVILLVHEVPRNSRQWSSIDAVEQSMQCSFSGGRPSFATIHQHPSPGMVYACLIEELI